VIHRKLIIFNKSLISKNYIVNIQVKGKIFHIVVNWIHQQAFFWNYQWRSYWKRWVNSKLWFGWL